MLKRGYQYYKLYKRTKVCPNKLYGTILTLNVPITLYIINNGKDIQIHRAHIRLQIKTN